MWDKYESTSKEWVKMMTEAGLDLPYMRASQRDDGHYYYLFPLDNYASIDKMQGIFGAAIEKIGKDKWAKFIVENESSMETHKDFIAKWSAAIFLCTERTKAKTGRCKIYSLDVFSLQIRKS